MSFQSVISSLTVTAVLLTGVACSKNTENKQVSANPNAAIVNGRPVVATDVFAKHTVALGPKEEPQCTGVVISAHHILTAGHCAEAIEGGVVLFGLDYTSATVETRKILKIKLHPSYCESCMSGVGLGTPNDVSVVLFEGDLPKGFEPITFAPKSLIVKGAQVHLAGYGANEHYDYEPIMKVTEVPVNEVGVSEFNTDETKSGSCNGDSGGPVFIESEGKTLLAGITSRGDNACRKLGVYTMPVFHEKFIMDFVKETTPTTAAEPVAANTEPSAAQSQVTP